MNSSETLYYAIFKTEAGWIGVSGTGRGLSRTTLPQKSKGKAASSLSATSGNAIDSIDYFKNLIEEFMAYFHGYYVDFQEIPDLSPCTPFERAVWETTRSIPYGETRSYSWVAGHIGKPLAPRAVGQALGRNPLPIIIPCHRVLTSDGKLGGFGGGLEMKQYLLNLESKK